jgi:hypothetical protein
MNPSKSRLPRSAEPERAQPSPNPEVSSCAAVKRFLCELLGHRWRAVTYASKECTRCGLRSGGCWEIGIP